MVGHQHIGMNATACLACVFAQPVQVTAVILIRHKADLPVIAALNQMQGDIGQHQTGTTA